jgi:DNA-binding CsgD family transcriptional regulator
MLSDEDLAPMVEDMRANGYDHSKPILRYRGQVLDGRNRLRAAALAGVEPSFRDLDDDHDPYDESWRQNGLRRDITRIQKACIRLEIQAMSKTWAADQARRREEANRARSEKAKAQHAVSNPRAGESSGRSSNEDRPKRDNRTVTELAKEAGVSRPTIERAMQLRRDDPEKFEAALRGDKKPRKPVTPRVDHDQRAADVARLHAKGLRTSEIAEKTGLAPTTVSKMKSDLGIAQNSPATKTRLDLTAITSTLSGAASRAESLAGEIDSESVQLDREEIQRCVNKITEALRSHKRLLGALKRRLQR